MVRTEIYIATEDALSEAVAERLIEDENQGMAVAARAGRKGNSYLRRNLPSYADLARSMPVFLLTDLDREECPARLIEGWRGTRTLPQGLIFRVAVRETESWLLADREGLAAFSGIAVHRLPENPDRLDDPKESLLNLVRRYANRAVKDDILPKRKSTARIGLAYNQALCGFVTVSWSPARAAEASDSLRRTIERIHELRLRHQV